jgi:signal transduction histidine kinase
VTGAGGVSFKTVSLWRRVTVTSVAVVALVLLVLAAVIGVLANRMVDRGLNAVLADRVQLAQQLAKQNASAGDLLERVDNRGVRAQLRLVGGRVLGRLPNERNDVKIRQVKLASGTLRGAVLTLELDTRQWSGAKRRLRRVAVWTSAAGLVAILVGLPFAVKHALAPLDSMTRLAGDIAGGRRGQRLSPDRTDTELGRTAAAFDDMLDALEGAEARARASEERTRRFVADAAHELRTPIAGVKAIAEAVAAKPENADDMLLLLVREAHRAGRLVDDLLDLARIDAGLQLRMDRADLRELAGAQVERVSLLHPEIAFDVLGPPTTAVVDPARISQVLANLLNNSGRFTPAGGRVVVEIRPSAAGADVVVTDTGPGVPPGDRERIFGRLVRLDAARERASFGTRSDGSGLGLTIARGIARAHGGDLTCVEPEPGTRGAAFLLRLPAT